MTTVDPGPHVEEMEAAIRADGEGLRLLLDGDEAGGRERLREAVARYRTSWELAPPRSYGRLIGMLKAAVIGGDAGRAAAYVRDALGPEGDSPASWYALGLAALVEGDDALAVRAAEGMRADAGRGRSGSDAFLRTAEAIAAIAERDRDRYARALDAIVADFEAREEHLTGVAIADTAVVLERVAADRGMAANVQSPLMPAL
jgi:hypothetical protein